MDALMDAAILVTLDPELASDMVKLLGEQLKRLRAKSCALEEELRIAREAQPGIQEETDVRGAIDALNVQIEGLRETVRLRDEKLSQKAETVAVLENTVSQKDAVLRVCAAEAKKNQDMITKLSNANSKLRKSSARMRTRNEQVARNDKAVGALQTQLVEKEDKLRALEDYKKMAELSLFSLSNERDQARAMKSKLEEKSKAQLELLKVSTQERDRHKADVEKYQAEAKKHEAEAKKYEAEVRKYAAQAKEAKNMVNNPAWAVQFGQFIAMMQALPEPTETLPCRSNIRPCLSAECVGHTPRVFEIIHQVYNPQTVLYLPDLPLWHLRSRHGVAVIPAYTYVTNVVAQRSEWTPNPLRAAVHGQTREVFYREKTTGKITYAGTYTLHASPALLGVTPEDHVHLNLPANTMKMLARRTLEAAAGRDQGMFDVVVAAYTQGVLPFGMLGLQCVGYKAGFDEPLRAWAAQNLKTLPGGERGAVVATPMKVSRVEHSCPATGVSEPAEPRPRGDSVAVADAGPSKCAGNADLGSVADVAGKSKEVVLAKPKKRQSDVATTSDPRKRARKVTELIVEPVPAEPMNPGAEVKREGEVSSGAVSLKSERS